MDREEVFAFTAGCINGEPASCTYACPFRLDLRSFLRKAAKGRWAAAYKELRTAVLFPALVAALCEHPCEDSCQLRTVLGGEPVSVGRLEEACLRYTPKKEPASYVIPPRPERIAVVGAGPAGLACALLLAQKRYAVTVFDRNEGWGGSVRAHPRFGEFEADFALQFSTLQAAFRFGEEVRDLAQLEDFDAVFVATGAGGEDFGLLGGWDPAYSSTLNPKVFLGGELTGQTVLEGMALAVHASKAMEAYIQAGSPSFAHEQWDRSLCTRYVPHRDREVPPPVLSAAGDCTEEEARREAERCRGCDCANCMDVCELLITYKKKPPRIANDVFLDGQGRNSVSSACITRQTWSCNLCSRCTARCHTGVDLSGLFEYSRADRVRSGGYPPALHAYWLREMDFAAGEGSLAAAPAGRSSCEYAFFPGCRLGASNPDYVLRSYAFLREKLDAGLLLNCCGVPALWAGEEELFHNHLRELERAWEKLGGPTLVTACPTCERTLERFLPALPHTSLYGLLAGAEGAAAPFDRAAVFDPCAAAGRNSLQEAVRELAAEAGITLTDFHSDGKCCGFGGHMQLANPGLYEEIVGNRISEAEEPYIVYCTNCREVFASRGKPCAHILDVVFGLQRGAVPTLGEKRENSVALKKELLEKYWGESFEPRQNPWDGLKVSVTKEARDRMERFLIPLSDVRETIWRSEAAGEGFVNAEGEILCRLAGPAVTCWVRYKKAEGKEDEILVTDVYSHRMRAREET